MKKMFCLIALLVSISGSAQQSGQTAENNKNQAVYMELLGASTMVGVNYDARFNHQTHWGWRAGLSFAYSSSDNFFSYSTSTRAWAVPLGVNYLLGNWRNNLEIGAGVNLGVYNNHYVEPLIGPNGGLEEESENLFGYYIFADLGYRHVSRSGFLFRAGLSPSFNFGDDHAVYRGFGDEVKRVGLSVYLGFGWAF